MRPAEGLIDGCGESEVEIVVEQLDSCLFRERFADPSTEPLSTTITSYGVPLAEFAKEPRHASVRSRVFQLTIRIETSTAGQPVRVPMMAHAQTSQELTTNAA